MERLTDVTRQRSFHQQSPSVTAQQPCEVLVRAHVHADDDLEGFAGWNVEVTGSATVLVTCHIATKADGGVGFGLRGQCVLEVGWWLLVLTFDLFPQAYDGLGAGHVVVDLIME